MYDGRDEWEMEILKGNFTLMKSIVIRQTNRFRQGYC